MHSQINLLLPLFTADQPFQNGLSFTGLTSFSNHSLALFPDFYSRPPPQPSARRLPLSSLRADSEASPITVTLITPWGHNRVSLLSEWCQRWVQFLSQYPPRALDCSSINTNLANIQGSFKGRREKSRRKKMWKSHNNVTEAEGEKELPMPQRCHSFLLFFCPFNDQKLVSEDNKNTTKVGGRWPRSTN